MNMAAIPLFRYFKHRPGNTRGGFFYPFREMRNERDIIRLKKRCVILSEQGAQDIGLGSG